MGAFAPNGDRGQADAGAGPYRDGVRVWGLKPALLISVHAWENQRIRVAQRMERCIDQMCYSSTLQAPGWAELLLVLQHGPFAWLARPTLVLSPPS